MFSHHFINRKAGLVSACSSIPLSLSLNYGLKSGTTDWLSHFGLMRKFLLGFSVGPKILWEVITGHGAPAPCKSQALRDSQNAGLS